MMAKRFKMFFMGIVMLALFSAVIMLLWNLLIPGIFGLAMINFWQALGLFILSRILFGSFGAGRMMMAHGMHHGRGHNPLHDKWMKMSDEERREFIDKRRKFGFGGPSGKGGFSERKGFDINRNEEPGKDNE